MLRPGGQDRLLWLFWAAKEAAYKAASKVSGNLSFIPRRFEVILDGFDQGAWENGGKEFRGVVMTPALPVYFEGSGRGDYVYVIAATQSGVLKEVISGLDLLDDESACGSRDSASRKARKAAISALALHTGLDSAEIEIRRERLEGGRLGPPFPCRHGIPLPYDLSLSHHGRFVAYAFVPNREQVGSSLRGNCFRRCRSGSNGYGFSGVDFDSEIPRHGILSKVRKSRG